MGKVKYSQRRLPSLVRAPLCNATFGVLVALSPFKAGAQVRAVRGIGPDSVVVVAGDLYSAGSFRRFMLGDNYRDLWTTAIKVPVLNLKTYRGGLRPTKEGGGKQTKSLRLATADGSEVVFRSVRKVFTILPDQYKGSIVWSIVRDQGSASHPLGAVAAAPMLGAARVLHPTPVTVMMPDDPALGEFRKEYGGTLGMIEEYPDTPENAPGFAGAEKIIDSEELLPKINADPAERVDARALLTVRLMDLLLGDNDRHPGQWKWARFGKEHQVPWEPIPRDRDKVFVSYEGVLISIARFAVPSLITFSTKSPDPAKLFDNAGEFDRRMLGSLDKAVWDSVAASLMQRITDGVIDDAVATLPPEWAGRSRQIGSELKARRNGLRAAAEKYYGELWPVADIHGTDADDQATVVRSGDGIVDVRLQSGNDAPYFARQFDARDTKEIRIYLHGGNDRATVEGNARQSITMRIIGGNGTNTFVDNSIVGSKWNQTRFYDAGSVQDVKYAKDTIDEKKNADNAFNHSFNRRPWLRAYGTYIPPQKDHGTSIQPVVGLGSHRGLGITPRIGLKRYGYGFRDVPYSSMVGADVAYGLGSGRVQVRTMLDKRFEESDWHIPATASMSQFEVVQFHGFGNDVADLRGRFYDVRQRQWKLNPAIGLSLSPVSDISLGPIIRYTSTDSLLNRFITQQRPYGFTKFGEAGLRLKVHLDTRYYPDTMKPRAVLDVTGTGYPAAWDVATPYQSLDAVASAFFTLPVAKKPVLALRAGGKKLWGNFPFFDAAYLGGSETLRTEDRQRYVGDASLYGTTELRVPIAKFPFILPLDVGAIGVVDAGRVYMDGQSQGGWHKAAGAGFWVGFLDPGKSVTVLFTNQSEHRIVSSFGFAF